MGRTERGQKIIRFLVVLLIVILAFWSGLMLGSGSRSLFYDIAFSEQVDGKEINVTDSELYNQVWQLVDKYYLGEQPDEKEITYNAIRGSLNTLQDPYTIFIEPVVRTQERESLAGHFGGIGAYLERTEAGDLILMPIDGNPAEKAGILYGDILLAVDEVPITAELSVHEIADMIRGEKGTEVELHLLRGEEALLISVERDDILIPSVSYRQLVDHPEIGYIQLTRFSGESTNEIEEALDALLAEDVSGIVLDLRGNGGGLLHAAVDVADHFLQGGIILYQLEKDKTEETFKAKQKTIAADIPLVVLINGRTASASEIVAGALQDRGRATLIGDKSYGKGSVQLVFDLKDGSSVHITSARWLTPERQPLDGNGLVPDIEVSQTQEGLDNGRDEQLLRAVQYLKEQ